MPFAARDTLRCIIAALVAGCSFWTAPGRNASQRRTNAQYAREFRSLRRAWARLLSNSIRVPFCCE
jgi:hypothetical protein